jgi:hypothetical protein
MATQADVRRIAMKLPHVEAATQGIAFSVPNKGKAKGFVWLWMERVNPKRPRIANAGVVAIRVANLAQKDALIFADPKKFFTEPHYNGFPAVLVRLEAASSADLKVLLDEAWRCMAPRELIAAHDTARDKSRKSATPKRSRAAKTGSSTRKKSKVTASAKKKPAARSTKRR